MEDETLACGTGATAVALAIHNLGKSDTSEINLNVQGGQLKVTFDKVDGTYKNVMLIGPAIQVFKGTIAC